MDTTTTFNIALPPDLSSFVEAQVRAGGYEAISDYIRDLIREAQKRTAQLEFEKLILEGLDSPLMDGEKALVQLKARASELDRKKTQRKAHHAS